jgi:hypothetical protein
VILRPVNLRYLEKLIAGSNSIATNKELVRYARRLAFGSVNATEGEA